MKISKSFETLFSDLKRCLGVSMTYLHSDKTIFREKNNRVASLKDYLVGSVQLEADDGSLSPHAMVLDTMKDGKFIFKNTHSADKKFEIEGNHENAPDEFFFVHIQLELGRVDQILQRIAKRSRKRKAEENQRS